jgi:RecB family exonuclease
VKIQKDLPYFWLSDEDNIILCGKIDWLEYLPETDSVHIIDFKTGRSEENEDSLQLPIYRLLVHECQHRQTTKASYWYLNNDDSLTEKSLPDIEESRKRILEVAKKIKLARQLQHFKCPKDGCYSCAPMEEIYSRQAELVGTDEYNYDVYILDKEKAEAEKASVIL